MFYVSFQPKHENSLKKTGESYSGENKGNESAERTAYGTSEHEPVAKISDTVNSDLDHDSVDLTNEIQSTHL